MHLWTEIRRKVLVDGASKRAICRGYKIGWRALEKILELPEPPGYRQSVEHGYQGSEVTVRRYVAVHRRTIAEVFVPFSQPTGEIPCGKPHRISSLAAWSISESFQVTSLDRGHRTGQEGKTGRAAEELTPAGGLPGSSPVRSARRRPGRCRS
jgi:hypothetical protein